MMKKPTNIYAYLLRYIYMLEWFLAVTRGGKLIGGVYGMDLQSRTCYVTSY